VWNETEAIPLQIKSAQSVGAMPELAEVSRAVRLFFEGDTHLSFDRHDSHFPGSRLT
jgi:hypothetical protein